MPKPHKSARKHYFKLKFNETKPDAWTENKMQSLHATHYNYLQSIKTNSLPYPQWKEQHKKIIRIRNLHLLLDQAFQYKSYVIYCTEEKLQMLPRGTTHRRSKFSSHLKINKHETSNTQFEQQQSPKWLYTMHIQNYTSTWTEM